MLEILIEIFMEIVHYVLEIWSNGARYMHEIIPGEIIELTHNGVNAIIIKGMKMSCFGYFIHILRLEAHS